MRMVEQAELACQLTGSSLDARQIMFGISTHSRETKVALCREIDELVKRTGVSFEEAFPHIKGEAKIIAIKYRIDLTNLCWTYLCWLEGG